MGLISAAIATVSSTLGDQWREYFYCDSLSNDVLMSKGMPRVSAKSSNKKGSDNIISNGSIIAVNEGQCMMIVEQGQIVDFCAEAGEFVYDTSTEPSLFYGNLGENLKNTFATLGKRFTFGGDTAKDQRVYFFNIKEIIGNLYGTPNPVPFRVVDNNIGLDVDISIRCNGEYSFRITDPLVFYKNVCGNVEGEYRKDQLMGQMRTEFLTALQPAFAKISEMGIRYSAVPGHTLELADAMNDQLSEKWGRLRGIEIVSVGVNSMKASEEDEAMIKELQRNATLRNPNMAAATLTAAQADAMKMAASNTNGAAMAFMGMGMAQQAGGMNAQQLFQMGAQPQYQQPQQPVQQPQMQAPTQAAADAWNCPSCNKPVNGKFCPDCGAKKPEAAAGWTCSCGSVNQGKFCANCGSKKPAGVPQYKCDKCGWTPADPTNPPKFCPQCGDPFGDEDIVQ